MSVAIGDIEIMDIDTGTEHSGDVDMHPPNTSQRGTLLEDIKVSLSDFVMKNKVMDSIRIAGKFIIY